MATCTPSVPRQRGCAEVQLHLQWQADGTDLEEDGEQEADGEGDVDVDLTGRPAEEEQEEEDRTGEEPEHDGDHELVLRLARVQTGRDAAHEHAAGRAADGRHHGREECEASVGGDVGFENHAWGGWWRTVSVR